MLTYTGKYNTAHVMIDEIDEETVKQIYSFLNHPAFEKSYIAIMPDCHAGAGSCIGFTMKTNNYIIPNIVGVDIGCGVLSYKIDAANIDLKKLDQFIHKNIPAGFSHRSEPFIKGNLFKYPSEVRDFVNDVYLTCQTIHEDQDKVMRQLGTLGGGNHFIEVDKVDDKEEYWLTIHTGSRNFGLRVANYHQRKAKELLKTMFVGAGAYNGLEYMPWEHGGNEYWADMQVAQKFAEMNRHVIAKIILEDFFKQDINGADNIESVHNYISAEDNIIRKGAIAAYNKDYVLIPFNMRDGIAVGKGRSNKRWNFSAPHGAGRIMSRARAKRELSMVDFQNSMNGIYTTTVTEETLDEAPMVYKDKDLILEAIAETVEVKFLMKPVYNFKAGGE